MVKKLNHGLSFHGKLKIRIKMRRQRIRQKNGIPVAIINGTCEEILWRGLYIKNFPNKVMLGLIYPSIGFAIWHLSPQLVFPSEGGIIGVLIFIISTFFLGFCYGWVSYKTKSIKWNALSHSLNSILAFGIPISSSLVTLIFS